MIGPVFDVTRAFPLAPAAVGVALARPWGLGILLGNTRTLWPRFVTAWHADVALQADPDPLDRYIEREAAAVCERMATQTGVEIALRFAHRPDDAGAYLPFQQLAVQAGLGALAPTRLVLHPVYGPWWALRALLVLDLPPPPAPEPISLRCLCAPACHSAADDALMAPPPQAWRAWVKVRSMCTIGQTWRYSDEQIAYHGEKDPAVLERSSARSRSE